jgi:integrase
LWTRPETGPDGKPTRVRNTRWGKGKRWLACWIDPDGRETSRAFKTQVAADKHWQGMETDKERGEYRWPCDDRHVRARSYSETVWKPALVKAGIIPGPVKDERGRSRYVTTRKEGVHQLRHYYASVTLAGGVTIKELAEYLGHRDPAFTLRVYAHLLPSTHDRARMVINERFAFFKITEQ